MIDTFGIKLIPIVKEYELGDIVKLPKTSIYREEIGIVIQDPTLVPKANIPQQLILLSNEDVEKGKKGHVLWGSKIYTMVFNMGADFSKCRYVLAAYPEIKGLPTFKGDFITNWVKIPVDTVEIKIWKDGSGVFIDDTNEIMCDTPNEAKLLRCKAKNWWSELDEDQKPMVRSSWLLSIDKLNPERMDKTPTTYELMKIYEYMHRATTINRAIFGVSYSEEEVKELLRDREKFVSDESTDFVSLDEWFKLNKKK